MPVNLKDGEDMDKSEIQNAKPERPTRRTGIIYMRKKDLCDAL